ncbi:hypothetical protein [Salinispora arenicola]|uniref:hypothetical protein n=1 Tax=Salinispora arenicola TaxID=168697 RepID=UPI0003625367|nr:hypothetical protein [Salinispora arenicola]
MSQYDIPRSCGHTETVNIRGPNTRGQRDSRAEWLAGYPCRDCTRTARQQQHAELAARALTLARLAGWPELHGSARKVPWATEVRATMLAEVVARICDPRSDPGPVAQAFDAEDWRYTAHPRGEEIAGVYVTAALRQTEADWWLDRRGLGKRIRTHIDLLEDAGIARHEYGGLLAAIETLFTDDDRAQIAAAQVSPA